MAIKHLTPRSLSKKQLKEYEDSYLTPEEAEFIEDMSENLPSAMEIYLTVKQCKKLYDLVVNKKYKIKAKLIDEDDYDYFYDDMYRKLIKPLIEKGWKEFWDEDNMSLHEIILIKAPVVKVVKEDMGGAVGGVSAPMATLANVPGMGSAVAPSAKGTGSGDNWGNTIGGKPYTQAGQIKKKKVKRTKNKVKKVKESLNEILSEIPTEVDDKNIDKEILRAGIIAEMDAINLYEQFAGRTKNKRLKEMLLDIAKEEKTHVGEFESFLLSLDKEQEDELKNGEKELGIKESNVSPYDKIGQSMLKRAKVKSVFKKKKDPKNQNAMKQQKFEHEITPFVEFKKISENQ